MQPSPSMKALAHWMSGWGGGSRPLNRHLPSPPTPMTASKIKQTFLSTNLASLLVSEQRVARPHFRLQGHSYKSKLVTGIIYKFRKLMKFEKSKYPIKRWKLSFSLQNGPRLWAALAGWAHFSFPGAARGGHKEITKVPQTLQTDGNHSQHLTPF